MQEDISWTQLCFLQFPILLAKCKVNFLNIFTQDYLRPWKFGTHPGPNSLIIIGCYLPGFLEWCLVWFWCVYQDVCCWVIGVWISSVYCKELLVMYSLPCYQYFLCQQASWITSIETALKWIGQMSSLIFSVMYIGCV